MFFVIGPVRTMPSACRGEAVNSMPNRPMSKLTFPQAANSASQALQPPAETWRSLRERPKSRTISVRVSTAVPANSSGVCPAATISPSLRDEAKRCPAEKRMTPAEQAFSHCPQKTHLPRSRRSGWRRRAPVGQIQKGATEFVEKAVAEAEARPSPAVRELFAHTFESMPPELERQLAELESAGRVSR